jgi:flagellar M-ring protein FliF
MEEAHPIRAFVRRRPLPLAIAGIVLISALLAAAWFLWLHKPYAVLFRDLRTMDAATIVAELDRRKVPYRLADDGRTILVPQNQVEATRLAVMSQELPLKGVVGFELFSKSDMGLTEFAQRINYRRALQGEIARTIMALDTVESARVHLSLSEASVFREDRKPAKASVSIVPRGGRSLSPQTIRGLQRLVAAAVPDLDPADVVVIDEGGAVVSPSDPGVAAAAPPAVQEKAAIEAYYAGRVRLLLRAVLPDDQVRVEAQAGWDPTAAPGDVGGDLFADWSPATRRFPLHVTVSTAAPVGPQVRDQIQVLAGRAIGLRPEVGDSVAVSLAPAPAPVAAEPRAETGLPVAPAAASPPAPGMSRCRPNGARHPGTGRAPAASGRPGRLAHQPGLARGVPGRSPGRGPECILCMPGRA